VQVATQVFPFFHVPEWVVRWIVIAAIIGFPLKKVGLPVGAIPDSSATVAEAGKPL
jgi:hypothetical protein